jgi:hypothetical protein
VEREHVQFRVGELLIAMGVVAFGFASLTRSDALFETLFFSFSLLIVLIAMLMAIAREGGPRAFWIGFAVSSASYLALAHIPDSDGTVPRHNGPELTTQLLRVGYNWLRSGSYDTSFSPSTGGLYLIQDALAGEQAPSDPFAMTDQGTATSRDPTDSFPAGKLSLIIGGGQRIISSGDSVSFMRIGHAMWALLIGWVAGHFTRFAYDWTRRARTRARSGIDSATVSSDDPETI